MAPRKFGDVHEAVDATQVHEGAEVDDGRDRAGADLTGLEVLEELLALLGVGLLEVGTAGQHHVVAVLVELDDLALELPADIGREVADPAKFDEGCGQEAPQADVDDETALDDLDDGTLDDAFGFLDLLDRAPGPLVLSLLLREEEPAFLVFLVGDEGLDLLAHGDDPRRVDVLLDRELVSGDNTLGLEADIDEHLVLVDLDDGAGDEVPLVEGLDGRVDGSHELGMRDADVVGGDG